MIKGDPQHDAMALMAQIKNKKELLGSVLNHANHMRVDTKASIAL
jgi:hypothetical protein